MLLLTHFYTCNRFSNSNLPHRNRILTTKGQFFVSTIIFLRKRAWKLLSMLNKIIQNVYIEPRKCAVSAHF